MRFGRACVPKIQLVSFLSGFEALLQLLDLHGKLALLKCVVLEESLCTPHLLLHHLQLLLLLDVLGVLLMSLFNLFTQICYCLFSVAEVAMVDLWCNGAVQPRPYRY